MSDPAHAKLAADLGPARLVEVEPGTVCAGHWGNVTLTRWQSRGTGPAVERVARVSRAVRAEYTAGISSVHLICEGAGMPTPEAREGLAKLMNQQVDQLKCVAVVIGGKGFWASAIRSLVTGMRGMSARSYELRLLGSIDELVNWLPALHSQRTGIGIRSDALGIALHAADRWDAGPVVVENN